MILQKKITVSIVEDYLLIRNSLVHIIGKENDFQILGSYESAEDFFEDFTKHQPDIVIMDLGLPGMNGLEATKRIKEINNDTKVVILTSHENEDEVLAALASGANSYCLKDIDTSEWQKILKDVYKGVCWLHPNIAYVANKKMPKPNSTNFDNLYNRDCGINLTDREKETLALIVEGKTNTEIAEKMHISTHTAKAHVCNILVKLSVTDRVQAAVKAIRAKIVD